MGHDSTVGIRHGVGSGEAASTAPLWTSLREDFERHSRSTEIADEAVIGRRVAIGHHQAVQIPAFAVIGDDSTLRSGITLGFTNGETRREAVPHIGRDVSIGPGAVLLGAITVGDGASIGPNANVSTDVPAGAAAFAPPARILKPQQPRPQPDETASAAS